MLTARQLSERQDKAPRPGGDCSSGHKLARDLVTCERCFAILDALSGYHVNSRNRWTILAMRGLKFLPYTVEDYKAMRERNWDQNLFPWERSNDN